MTPSAANVCPRDENGTPKNPQKIMGPRWGRLRGPHAVPNGLLKGSLFRRLAYVEQHRVSARPGEGEFHGGEGTGTPSRHNCGCDTTARDFGQELVVFICFFVLSGCEGK